MKYRAVIKRSSDWWIGWLVDLPGVNAQERTRDRLIESLRIGAQEMLETEVPFETEGWMTTVPRASAGSALPGSRSKNSPFSIIRNNLKTAGISRDEYFSLLEQLH